MERRAFRVDPRILEVARAMRAEQTPAEQKLWWCVRSRRLAGFKFRRQHPVDRYVVDLYCAECRLVVELDGPSHHQEHQKKYDANRTADLERAGCTVVRIPNREVHENIDGVLKFLFDHCERLAAATVGPSP